MTPRTPWGVRHGLITGNLPLDGGGERRKLDRLDETEELLARNVGACPVRHRGSKVPRGLEAEVLALWMLKNSESRERAREVEDDGKAKSRICARRVVLKGQARLLTFNAGPAELAGLSPTHARAPAKQPPTRAMPRFPQNTGLQCLRAVMMERSRPSHQPRCSCPLLCPHLPRRP
jgi:hypothetical protein